MPKHALRRRRRNRRIFCNLIDGGAAPVPGMSPEAAARLAEAKLREELLGRVEGQYKLRGETCPLSVQKQTVAELEATLAELRGERE